MVRRASPEAAFARRAGARAGVTEGFPGGDNIPAPGRPDAKAPGAWSGMSAAPARGESDKGTRTGGMTATCKGAWSFPSATLRQLRTFEPGGEGTGSVGNKVCSDNLAEGTLRKESL